MIRLPKYRLESVIFLLILLHSLCGGFGKNKVQYLDFSWYTITSPHFKIHSHQGQHTLTDIAPFWIEHAFRSLQTRFQYTPKERIPLIVYGTTNLFTQTNIITELLPEEVGGFTEIFKNRIAIPFNGSYKDFRHVLHHELVHGFVFSMLTEQFGSNMLVGNLQIPLWFNEGMAEFLSSGWDTEADMFMIDRALNSTIPLPGPELDILAYKGGQSFLHFLASSRGDTLFGRFLTEFKASKRVDNSIQKVYRKSLEDIGKEWILELKRLYWPEIGCRIDPSSNASAITRHTETRDFYNLRPRISPDGKKIAFFSDRHDYTRILITDIKGKVLHQISQNGYGGYFESFHPFRSGMCWSPKGERLAFVTADGGSDEIRIVDIRRKRLVRRIRTHLNVINAPDWSRDGSVLVFSSVDSGKSDLYLYHLSTGQLERLTNSVEFESDPRFSPDGKHVVFSIEDTCGNPAPAGSAWGPAPSDLALLELSTGKIRRLHATPWSEKQPCFSPDGLRLLFVSDRNGIDNIYCAPLDSLSSAWPVTNYTGGCSNPDWSSPSDRLVFSLFNKQGWDIWLLSDLSRRILPDTLIPTRWVASFNGPSSVFFLKSKITPDSADSSFSRSDSGPTYHGPKTDSPSSGDIASPTPDTISAAGTALEHDTVVSAESRGEKPVVDDSTSGEPSSPDSALKTEAGMAGTDSSGTRRSGGSSGKDKIPLSPPRPYRLSFSPDMVSVGLGISNVYSPAGQVLVGLSDLLGDHRITFAGDIQGNFKDYLHGYLSYSYLKHRMDVGAGTFYSKDYTFASVFGDKLYHDTRYGGFGSVQYPFSMFSRLELNFLGLHIEQKPLTFSGPTLTSNMLVSSLSYVFDNILWGITGPLHGLRAAGTFQLSPPFDFITEPYLSLEADVRHYLHLFKRFVWANRIFVGGSYPLSGHRSARRYLLGGNDQWLIFQVDIDEYEKNVPYAFYSDFITPFRGWNYVAFSGTRVAVLNSEFRFPFIREISLVWPLPVQIRYINGAVFTDIGNAWEKGEKFGKLPLPKDIYGGFGFGMRANLGFMIVRFDRGWPTDWTSWIGAPINYFSFGAEF